MTVRPRAVLAGFYCANTVSLSFGTLAVNDVVAAAVTVAFCEVGCAGGRVGIPFIVLWTEGLRASQYCSTAAALSLLAAAASLLISEQLAWTNSAAHT